LEEFFPTGFFYRVTFDVTSCTKLEDEEDGEEEKQEDSPKGDNKPLIILEALPTHIGRRQIFRLPEEIC